MKLGDDDARAVDLLLDRTTDMKTDAFATPQGDSVAQRIGATETVFKLLAAMPAVDPPDDLTKKTMDFIRERGHQPGAIEGDQPPMSELDHA